MEPEETPEHPHGTGARALWFIFWNLLSVAVMLGIFFAIRDVERWNGFFEACFQFFFRHETLAVLAAMYWLLGENATVSTGWLCPKKVASSRPVADSHNFTVRSQALVAKVFPSGAKAAAVIAQECPSLRRAASCSVVESHNRKRLS